MGTQGERPGSLAEIGQLTARDRACFDASVREFLDAWQTMSARDRARAIAVEPQLVGAIADAYLAALAEHLATTCALPTPAWADNPSRTLDVPFFSGNLQALKATLLVESPPAFRRRLIFISANALERPRREFIQENALSVANLDV